MTKAYLRVECHYTKNAFDGTCSTKRVSNSALNINIELEVAMMISCLCGADAEVVSAIGQSMETVLCEQCLRKE